MTELATHLDDRAHRWQRWSTLGVAMAAVQLVTM
jgi:hypothetical protein